MDASKHSTMPQQDTASQVSSISLSLIRIYNKVKKHLPQENKNIFGEHFLNRRLVYSKDCYLDALIQWLKHSTF